MGKPYSMDLRERVVAAIEGGESTHQGAAQFSIGIATVGTWARLKRATGDVGPAKQGKPKGAVLDAHAEFILGALAEAPDTTLDEMVKRLRQERGVTVVRPQCRSFLDQHGQRLTKKTAHASEQERADVKAARENWVDGQHDLDPEHLIFIDESGLSTKMARLRGWAAQRRALPRRNSARSLGNRPLCRRPYACGLRCTDASGRPDGRRMLPGLRRADVGANLAPG